MKVVILTDKTPAALEASINGWLDSHHVHVHSVCYAVGTNGHREALIVHDSVPEPSDAAARWIGEQLGDRKDVA